MCSKISYVKDLSRLQVKCPVVSRKLDSFFLSQYLTCGFSMDCFTNVPLKSLTPHPISPTYIDFFIENVVLPPNMQSNGFNYVVIDGKLECLGISLSGDILNVLFISILCLGWKEVEYFCRELYLG